MITPDDEDRYVKNLFIAVLTVVIALLLTFLSLVVLSGCSHVAKEMKSTEEEEALTIRIDKEAFQNKRNISIYVETTTNEQE